MGVKEEAELLKKRSLEFLENAKENFEAKRYDLAAFNVEQSLQLLLKYFLFIKAGDYPRTHSLKTLFRLSSNFLPKLKELLQNEISVIGNIEAAYLGARYLPFEYCETEVKEMIDFAERVKEVVLNAV